MNSQMKTSIGQYLGKGSGTPMPSLGAAPSQHLHVFTNPEALQTP